MSLRDEIREQMRVKRMRMGQEAPERVTIPSMPEIAVELVPLLEQESTKSLMAASNIEVPDNATGIMARQRTAMQWDVWQSTRVPGSDEKVWNSVEEMCSMLEPEDIEALNDHLTVLHDYVSPSLDKLTDAEIDDLKKAFVLIDWRELTGRRWSALKLCLSLLLPELLQARSPSTTSTRSSTEMSESQESI